MIPFFLGASAAGGAPAVGSVFGANPYSGNGGTTTITNGVNLATPGGLVWIKHRTGASVQPHVLVDSIRGSGRYLASNTTDAEVNNSSFWTYAFNSTGWAITASGSEVNNGAYTYASWSFARAARFFDVVTWTGNGSAGRAISHNLGATPGMIIVKMRTAAGYEWRVWHRSVGNGNLLLNATDAAYLGDAQTASYFGNGSVYVAPTSTDFTVGASLTVNGSGDTYVAYLFAHDTASDGIVQCGSYTGNGSATGPTVTLGWEPQWLLIKNATAAPTDWVILDTARGITSGNDNYLWPNREFSENGDAGFPNDGLDLTTTGFQLQTPATNLNRDTDAYIYVAIREA
jgi:hypothetical protein